MWPATVAVLARGQRELLLGVRSCCDAASATAMMTTPRCTTMPPLARPTRPRQPWRRVASTSWRHGRAGGEPAEPEGDAAAPGRRAPSSDGDHERAGADPGRPEQPVAQQLAAGLAPRQHRRDGHEEQQREADRHASCGRSTARRPTMRLVAAAPRRAAGTRCRAARRTRTRRTARCWRGTRPRARPASRCARASAGGRRARRSARATTTTMSAEEREQPRCRSCRLGERVHASRGRRSG